MAVRSSMKTMPGMAAASRDGNAIRPRSESYSHRPRLRGRSFFPRVVAPGSPIELVRARRSRPCARPSVLRHGLSVFFYFCPFGSFPASLSLVVVLVVAAPPVTRLIAPLGSAVEPLPHAPEAVQSARIGRIPVVDD